MTNSMIPYSFIPGTKAKAGEVNANFIALADIIEQNKTSATGDINEIYEELETKADKTELINEFTVSEADTDLNDYKTKGTYIFTALYTPVNIPKGTSGTLIVTGTEDSLIKQIWFSSGDNPEIFTRDYTATSWGAWNSLCGKLHKANYGYLKLSNGILIQWGARCGSAVTYPVAFTSVACPVLMKQGYNKSAERSDGGFSGQTLTGFNYGSGGGFTDMNWIAIGF